VSKTGNIARHVRESFLEAHPEIDAELVARNTRPDLFALADDMVEAEMIRTGRLSRLQRNRVRCRIGSGSATNSRRQSPSILTRERQQKRCLFAAG